MNLQLSRSLNALGLLAVSVVLIAAFVDQLAFNDLPCPLCLLQRAGFAGVAVGLALNVKFGPRASHYGIIILSALAGAAVSMRQTLLHIVPGTGAYGDAVLGLHFYVWAFILFVVCVAGSALLLLFDRQFAWDKEDLEEVGAFGGVTIALALLLALANGASTVVECGGGMCPANPTSYQLIDDGTLAPVLDYLGLQGHAGSPPAAAPPAEPTTAPAAAPPAAAPPATPPTAAPPTAAPPAAAPPTAAPSAAPAPAAPQQ